MPIVRTLFLSLLVLTTGCATTIERPSKQDAFTVGSISSYTLNDKLMKANIAYEEGRLVEAEKWFLNILSQHNSLADAWFKLGNIYYRSGRYTAAVHAYENVLKNDNKFERAWYNLALTRVSQSVDVIDQSMIYIEKNSEYFRKSVNLKASLIGRVSSVDVKTDTAKILPEEKSSIIFEEQVLQPLLNDPVFSKD
ncbi:MAG: tetratricopeptide (TPR) repeat protein [Arenicella sp.]|jgi:tetratricopeptide (TPR) repeat protein